MAKAKIKKGTKLICVPCGREVIVSCCGISSTTLWCCGRPMKKSNPSLVKKSRENLLKRKNKFKKR